MNISRVIGWVLVSVILLIFEYFVPQLPFLKNLGIPILYSIGIENVGLTLPLINSIVGVFVISWPLLFPRSWRFIPYIAALFVALIPWGCYVSWSNHCGLKGEFEGMEFFTSSIASWIGISLLSYIQNHKDAQHWHPIIIALLFLPSFLFGMAVAILLYFSLIIFYTGYLLISAAAFFSIVGLISVTRSRV